VVIFRPMRHHLLTFAFMFATMSLAEAASPEIPLGQYVREGDSGTLTIRKDEQNRRTFEIKSIGANCHVCGVSGQVRGAIGRAGSGAGDGSDSTCDISFAAGRSAVDVVPLTRDECRAYCGARASFDGTYRVPSATCTSAGRRTQRDQSLRLYRSRRFSEAASKLRALTEQCRPFMNWIEMDQVRNDLALAQYHSGDFSQCLQTLSATLAADVKDEDELKAGKGNTYLPPCDFDRYIDVAKSTWFNKALCTKAISKGQ